MGRSKIGISLEEKLARLERECAKLDPAFENALAEEGLPGKVREARGHKRNMSMKSKPRGKGTSGVAVTNISQHGFWILLGKRELFVPFSEFPWFRDATIDSILKVEMPHARHLYWPDLDIDLAVESIEHPERFPLLSKATPDSNN